MSHYCRQTVLAMLILFTLSVNAEPKASSSDKLSDVMQLIDEHYLHPVDREALIDAALNAIFAQLDGYSAYHPKQHYIDEKNAHEGTGFGTGLIIDFLPEPTIVFIADQSPAQQQGLSVGMRIETVDGTDVTHYSQEALRSLLSTGVKDSTIALTVRGRDGLRALKLTREKTEQVDLFLTRDHDGLRLTIHQFSWLTPKHLAQWLDQYKDQLHQNSLTIDLRGNLGGSMKGAREAAELFLTQGSVLGRYLGKNNHVLYTYTADHAPRYPTIPLTLLIDQDTASAAEFFAGTLHANQRATLVGQSSRGKGTIQTYFSLTDGSGISLSTKQMALPNGQLIEYHGITPSQPTH